MASLNALLLITTLATGQARDGDFHIDFRGTKPFPANLNLTGPDAESVLAREAEGLRLTLPMNGKQTYGWGVAVQYILSGDFEVTGSFEILQIDQPTKGSGAGVALNVAPTPQRLKFAKVGRFFRVKGDSVFVAEYWDKEPPKDYKLKSRQTETRTGKLRLERNGSMMRYLVAEGLEGEFREIYSGEFGDEDLTDLRFIANNNTTPTLVDVRLLDLTVRSGKLIPATPFNTSKAWLPAALLAGLSILALLVLVVWRLVRRRAEKNRHVATDAGTI